MSQVGLGSRELFLSPCCRRSVEEEEAALVCVECGTRFPVENGLHSFVTEGLGSWGEFTSEEMNEILSIARDRGWRVALEEHVAPRSPSAAKLMSSERRANILEPLRDGAGGVALDLGCGYGNVSLGLRELYDQVVSLDAARERVSFLNVMRQQENLDGITPVWHHGSLNLPFADATFDAVVMIGVFEYFPISLPELSVWEAHDRCMDELVRILKPGGKLYIAAKNRFGWQFLRGKTDHSGVRFASVLPYFLANGISRLTRGKPYRIISYSLKGYTQLVKRAGLSNARLFWPVPDYQHPERVIEIDTDFAANARSAIEEVFKGRRQRAVRRYFKAGLLPRVIPHVAVVAVKPKA